MDQTLPPAAIKPSGPDNGPTGLALSGRLDSDGTAAIWKEGVALASRAAPGPFSIDLSGVDYLDGAGAGLVFRLQQAARERGAEPSLVGTRDSFADLLDLFDLEAIARDSLETEERDTGFFEELGRNSLSIWQDVKVLVSYVGELCAALIFSSFHPRQVRWRDFIHVCETAGVNALPIISLIGFLMGLIMAFQSAVPLRQFGADIFVADMLGISMIKELGPLVTAILLAGRSGSAFAAEIGTMKVNEEVNALTTMGLSPLRFLAVPRVLATMAMTPILTVFFVLFALVGGAVVVMSFGYPLVTYLTRIEGAVQLSYIFEGLLKALIFSVLVAGIGCQRGLTTGTGASAVGTSTTSSVVSGLILITVADGILAVIFFAVG